MADNEQTVRTAMMRRVATVVTASQRLARRILGDDAATHQTAGRAVWRRRDVLPWTAWLQRTHGDSLAAGALATGEPAVLLSATQAAALWERVIADDQRDRGLLQPQIAARHAAQAHALCLAWRIDRRKLSDTASSADVAAYLRWRMAFERELELRGWLVTAQLPDRIAAWAERVPSLMPDALQLTGFEELTPQQTRLIERLAVLGVGVQTDERSVDSTGLPTGTAVRVGCADANAEIVSAAHWARRRLQVSPQARIAIVVRDLDSRRDALARTLDAVLDPPAVASGVPRLRRPWNIAAGRRCSEEPLVHDALLILKVAAGRVTVTEASRLLRSPFLGDAECERPARIALELALRNYSEIEFPTARLLSRASDSSSTSAAVPGFVARLDQLLAVAAGSADLRSPGDWAAHFADLLRVAGWPGERGVDSREYQVLNTWQELLGELTALATVQPRLSRRTALATLRRLAHDRVFQPRSAPAPVQVLGLLDAIGQRFDALWLMGLDDEHWPATTRPNPLLPAELQRRLAMPHASAARELAHAAYVTSTLLAAAPEVVVSWGRRADDRNLRPSPLIADLPEGPVGTDLPVAPSLALLASAQFERYVDDRGPACAPQLPVRGGTDIFRDQSRCAFRAYAVHRLHATPIETPAAGLDAMARGSLVHRTLQLLWQRLGSSVALQRLDSTQRTSLAADIADDVLARARRERPGTFTPRFIGVERARLISLLQQWLDQENAREAFRVVEIEGRVRIGITADADERAGRAGGQLLVSGRIDRVDELADGRRILIDYKTGRAGLTVWLGDRPEEPQLLLYAGLFGDELAGVVFAQVRTGDCRWCGVTRDDTSLTGTTRASDWKAAEEVGWPALRAGWQRTLGRLAAAFLAGEAEVDPLPGACRYCHLASLCRVDDLGGGFSRDADVSEVRDDG